MKADSHDPVSMIERLFNSIPMMNVNIEVKHSWVDFEKL